MRALAVIACILLLGAGVARGETMHEQVDRLMDDYDGEVPGAAVLVVHEGEVVVRRGYGLAELEAATPVTPATNFRLASLTKQFTAAAVLLLAEDDRLRLDDPVRRWLPTLPDAADPITLHHLLSHTSGLVDYEEVMPERPAAPLRDADVLALLEQHDRLYFAPGTRYRYSNSAYALLALVVGKASGLDFARFLRQRVFAPLGMDGTLAFEHGASSVARRAYGHSLVDDAWRRTDQSSTSAVLGDGGVYSSIDDLAKWDAALYDERLLSDGSRALAFAAQTVTATGEQDVDAYGYGWRLAGDMRWHSGETIGFRNVILRYPRQRLTVVVLSNRNHPEPYPTARAIADLWLAPGTD